MKAFEPSIFDKLFDESPVQALRRRLSMDELKDSVARDLEALLNTRTIIDESLESDYPLALGSVASFGLNDFSGLSLASVNDRRRICASIERAIARHEPRLRDIEVGLELDRRSINALYFFIRGVLVVRPAQEPVSFDAMLQPTTLQYSVGRQRGRSGNS
ncbi:type VI secretion system baseplate subunit TssE [Denitromonas ohlonensis]|uniref:Type VI secretion system baseplate subunit TssE n=2 Tax=Denitromonas TaxID=139331 RepID=A0A557SDI8_9RHOO|nr:type VI secretion system baseplate subunit TssE [Denitromonas ohlonensis]TVO63676.1 type VI secretion system baseplate subunit TssE [Denitromonas ohlonensis]TVO75463.1 type VI secretion system baseplate subunit TssE [Denitromonas ohlonensis]